MTYQDHIAIADDASDEHIASARKQRIRTLFKRYPDITGEERRELAAYLRSGPLLEIGLLKGEDTIRYKIGAFEQEQHKALATTPMELVVLLLVFGVVAAVCAALWDIGV